MEGQDNSKMKEDELCSMVVCLCECTSYVLCACTHYRYGGNSQFGVYMFVPAKEEPRVPPLAGSPPRGCRPCCLSQLNFLTTLVLANACHQISDFNWCDGVFNEWYDKRNPGNG